MDNENNLSQINNICYTEAQLEGAGSDPFKMGISPDEASIKVKKAIGRFKAELRKDFDVGWQELMTKDGYSTRNYMMTYVGYSSWVRVCFLCPYMANDIFYRKSIYWSSSQLPLISTIVHFPRLLWIHLTLITMTSLVNQPSGIASSMFSLPHKIIHTSYAYDSIS